MNIFTGVQIQRLTLNNLRLVLHTEKITGCCNTLCYSICICIWNI